MKAKSKTQTSGFGCPKGHTGNIEQLYTVSVWLPVDLDSGDTDTDASLDGRETDNWIEGDYYCPECGDTFATLTELLD